MGKYIGHRLVARPEPDNTVLTASTLSQTVMLVKINLQKWFLRFPDVDTRLKRH